MTAFGVPIQPVDAHLRFAQLPLLLTYPRSRSGSVELSGSYRSGVPSAAMPEDNVMSYFSRLQDESYRACLDMMPEAGGQAVADRLPG
jgi:hypothetical protein